MKELAVGYVVYSKAGRDVERRYVVKEVLSNGYVMLVDGEIRKLGNPKKKNVQHCRYKGEQLEVLADKFNNGKEVFDSEIRKALRLVGTNNGDAGNG